MAIPTRITNLINISSTTVATEDGGGILYSIETPTGALYEIIVDINNDPAFIKSTDFGLTWSEPIQLKAILCAQLAVWYDRWTDPTGVMGDLIHIVYTDNGADDIFYRTIDTANSDTLGTERTVYSGSSTAAGASLSIARMIGGNILVVGTIDAGAEVFCRRSVDLGVNWTDRAAVYEASADQIIIMPGWGADTQDGMAFYYDNSANEITVKYYDDSGDSWSETSIATSITFPAVSTTLGHWSATIDHTNSQNLLAFWTAVDTAAADLRVFKVTQSAQTETASNVVLNSTDDQGFAAISIAPNDDWYVFYLGASNGSETYNSNVLCYFKKSTDGGTNWGSETILSVNIITAEMLYTSPRHYKSYGVLMTRFGTPSRYYYNSPLTIPHSTYQLGM